MELGHINLARSCNGTGEHFVALIEALDRQGINQFVIVRNQSLARRVAIYDNVTVAPITGSPVVACCLMPNVDVVHAHNEKSARAGLLLALTRSLPYVLSRRVVDTACRNPIARSIVERAVSLILCSEDCVPAANPDTRSMQVDVIPDIARKKNLDIEMLGNRAAAAHLRVYRRAAAISHIPALML